MFNLNIEWKYQRYLQDYMACVASVDESVGEILDYLKRTGLDKNTIVVDVYKRQHIGKVAPTPNIDRIGQEGAVFWNNYCCNSISGPRDVYKRQRLR